MIVNMSNTLHTSSIVSPGGAHRFSIAPNALPQRPKKAATHWNDYEEEEGGIHSPTLSNSPSMHEFKGVVPLNPVVAL